MSTPVNPHTPRNQVFTRKFYLDQTKKKATVTGINEVDSTDPSIFRCQLASGVTNKFINRYQPVIFAGTHWNTINTTTDHTQNSVIKGYHILETGISPRSWGVALDPITDTIAGRVRISGVTWLDTSSISTLIPGATHLNVIENALVQGYNGRACILQEMKKPHCLIELSNHRTILYGKTTSSGLTVGAEGEVYYSRKISTGWQVTSIRIKAWTTLADIDPNTEIVLLPIEGCYLAIALCDS